MSRPASLLSLVAVAVSTLGLSADALAGGCKGGGWRPIQPPAPTIRLRPISQPIIAPPVVPARQWYFGMSLQITNTPYGRGLQVASVTPGSPASLARLERGDILLVAGAVNLGAAQTNEHGVQLLQSAVGAGAPAPTAAATFVAPVVPQSPTVQLTVLNVRTGQPTHVAIAPQLVGGAPAPTAAAAAF